MATNQISRLAIVVSHPTQYYSPWFRSLSGQPGLQLRVFYLWDFGVTKTVDPRFGRAFQWDVDLLSGYESEIVPNASAHPGAESFFGFRNPGLLRRLSSWHPDAVLLFGYNWYSHLSVILWARLRRIPIIFRGDSHLIGRPQPTLRTRILLGFLFRQFSAIAYVGAANRDYFRALGVPDDRLYFAPHSIDATRFADPDGVHRAEATLLRGQLGIADGATIVLFAGKFVAEKQAMELLRAFVALAPANTHLVFVGDGEQRAALQTSARETLPESIHFLPFANQSEMPSRYALADLFVLPSRGVYETWGLAVNEAMHMGVPCLVSDRVGSQRDLVTDGETGWVFAANDETQLRTKLAEALTTLADPIRAARIHHAVAERIRRYTYAETSQGVRQAIASLGEGNLQ